MVKNPNAFCTISEVSSELDLPQHVLRFWETRFSQIKPLKRGGGRRYYRPEDLNLLKGIRHLLYDNGYTIKGVQRILKEQGIRHVASVWEGKQETIEVNPEEKPQEFKPLSERKPIVESNPINPDEVPDNIVQSLKSELPVLTHDQRKALEDTLKDLQDCQKLLEAAK